MSNPKSEFSKIKALLTERFENAGLDQDILDAEAELAAAKRVCVDAHMQAATAEIKLRNLLLKRTQNT